MLSDTLKHYKIDFNGVTTIVHKHVKADLTLL